jgi:hypothetical protein
VLVNLYNGLGSKIATSTTDGSGLYSFNNLVPDTYRIEIDATEFQSGGTLYQWYASPQNVGPDATDSDGHPTTHDITVALAIGVTDLTNDFGFDITSDYTITKQLNTVEPVRLGEPVSFTIRITNTGNTWIGILPLRDVYSTTYLSYVNASPASNDNNNDGQIDWSDLTVSFGTDLAPGASFTVIVNFTANADTSHLTNPNGRTRNTASVIGAKADADGPSGPLGPIEPLPDKSAYADVQIINPTGMVIVEANAAARPGDVLLTWRTADEAQVMGFNVLRSPAPAGRRANGGELVRLNNELIFAEQAGRNAGASYAYQDKDVAAGNTYQYTLEIVRSDGGTGQYELAPVATKWWIRLPVIQVSR